MATTTDYLIKIQDLTKQNLEILKTINDSFLTNKTHLKATIAGVNYSIPSFLSLENKINALRDDFENLVNAPKTGEAHFTFDGSSKVIELKGYNNTPPSLTLPLIENFDVEANNIFKDFLTPIPYINFSLASIPNDIVNVSVKKVIPKNQEIVTRFKEILGDNISAQYTWADMYKILSIYPNDDQNYIEYDTIRRLPLKKTIGTATYVVEEIISDTIDDRLDEYLTLRLKSDTAEYANNLTYKVFDDTIDKYLSVGDQLVTYDDSAKLEITDLQSANNTITVKILNGEYVNLIPSSDTTQISDSSKLKFFSSIESNTDKQINIPLEEDRYIFVAIAPLNDRMNIRAPWGSGLIIDTYKLTNIDSLCFNDYYRDNVKNIGDILNDITVLMSESVTKFTREEFNDIVNYKPSLDKNNLEVVQINSHLNDSDTVKNIRALYSQKKNIQSQLNEILTNIANINIKLNQTSFDDTTGLRNVYIEQLTGYSQTRNELNASLNKIIDEIALNANNSNIPIENAKYHIRGFYDIPSDIQNIRGIKVQYRYKNLNNTTGKALTVGDKFLFSDWNVMTGFTNQKIIDYQGGSYAFKYQDRTDGENVPSFNQIDIPISQGEVVDLRLKIIYDYGWPFAEITSDWSDIITISFPDEYLKDVQILDIITENNSDIEKYRFENIINDAGITSHIEDKIIDQDITYFHNPSHIASGFYTSERRIIPLKDKLEDITNLITQLQDEVHGNSASDLEVVVNINNSMIKEILPWQDNFIYPKSWNELQNNSTSISGYQVSNNEVVTLLNIILKNTSTHTLKLYPIFPGSTSTTINNLISTPYSKTVYCEGNGGVYMKVNGSSPQLQKANQFITFCTKNPYNGEYYYGTAEDQQTPNNLPTLTKNNDAVIYPYLAESNSLCLDSTNKLTYKIINPGRSVIIPLEMRYRFKNSENTSDIIRTISFGLRTSLYQDPINYTFKVTFKKDTSILDSINYNTESGNAYNITL